MYAYLIDGPTENALSPTFPFNLRMSVRKPASASAHVHRTRSTTSSPYDPAIRA